MKKQIWYLKTNTIYKLIFKHIGKRCYVGKPLLVIGKKKITFNNDVRILPGMRAEVYENSSLIFEGDNSVGQNLHIISGNCINIGFGTTISSNVFISDIDHTFEINKSAIHSPNILKKTIIGNYCFIGVGAVILPGTKLGNNVVVGANSTVKGEFPDNCIIAGSPAKIVKFLQKEEETK